MSKRKFHEEIAWVAIGSLPVIGLIAIAVAALIWGVNW